MKFMVSCRHPLVFLKNMQEIRVNYNDIERLADFVTEDWTCTADVVIYLPKEGAIEWSKIEPYKDVLNIILATEHTGQIKELKEMGYKVFWSYPASTFWELNGLLELDVDQILIDGPLYFDLPTVARACGCKVELRLVVDKCVNEYMPHKDGICGTYVRPEDVSIYEPFIQHMEFSQTGTLQKEYTLYHIYAENKQWPGDLNLLLTDLNCSVDNRGFETIPSEENDDKAFAHHRLICKQVCQIDKHKCNYCHTCFRFLNSVSAAIDKGILKTEEQEKE